MILYDLKCGKGHVFEAWFRDSETCETQVRGGEIDCPVCGSKKVAKAPMAPRVAKRSTDQDQASPEAQQAAGARRALRDLRDRIEQNFDYVGGEFAEEARKIHYGEAGKRNIYGETSDDEAKSLADEGVRIQRIPWLPRENS